MAIGGGSISEYAVGDGPAGGSSLTATAAQRLHFWRPLALAALGLLATEDYAQAKQPDLHAYRASSAHGGVSASYSQLVLIEAEQDAVRTDHNRRLLFGKSATAAPVVGAPWHLWNRKIPTQEAEEDAKRANHDLLHRYRTGYQTVGQPFSAWPKAQQRFGEEEFSLPKLVDLNPFRQPAAVAPTVGAPWYLWTPPPQRIEPEEQQPSRSASLYPYRQQTVTLPGTPWFLWQKPAPRVEAEEQDRAKPVDLTPYRQPIAATPTAGAPWYLWPKEKPRTEEEEFAPKRSIDLLAFQRIAYIPPLQGPADQTPVAFSQIILIEAEQDAVRTDHAKRLLFGRSAVTAPQAQNSFVAAPVQIPGEEAFELLPAKPTLHLFRSPPAVAQPGQPFLIWPKAQQRVDAEDQEVRKPVDLSPYRWPTVTPPPARAPWYLWNRTTLRIAEEEYTVPQPSQFALSRAIGGPFQNGYVTAPVHIPGEEEFLVLPDAPNVHRFRQITIVVPRGTPLSYWPPAVADQTTEPNPVVTNHALALYPFRPHEAIEPPVQVGSGGQDGAKWPKRKRRPVDTSPEVFEPEVIETPEPVQPEPESEPVKVARIEKILAELEKQQAEIQTIRKPKKAQAIQKRISLLKAQLAEAERIAAEIEDEDRAIEAAMMLLLRKI